MTLREWAARLVRGREETATVALYCPLADGKRDETRIATEGTEPDEWIQTDRVAVYECPVCGNRHRFLWGPPTPLYLGDCPEENAAGAEVA
jgi:hypothetical protein